MAESAIAQFLRKHGIEPSDNKKENLKLAQPIFDKYKREEEEKKNGNI